MNDTYSVLHLVKTRSFGGVAVSVINTCAAELKNSYKSRILFLVDEQQSDHLNMAKKHRVSASCVSTIGMAFSVILERLRRTKSSIINIHSGTSAIPGNLGRIAKVAGQKTSIIVSLHGSSITYPIRDTYSLHKQTELAEYANIIIIPNNFEKEVQISRGIPTEKLAIVPDIVEISAGDRSIIREDFNIPDSSILVGFCGRLEQEKGILETIRCFRKLGIISDVFSFIVAGTGTQGDEAQKLSDELNVNVIFLGHTNSVDDFLASLDIILIPSTGEAFGIIAVEAAKCLSPMALSSIRPWTDWLRPGVDCEMFDTIDGDIMAKAVQRLAIDPARRRKLALSAKIQVEKHYPSQEAFEFLRKAYASTMHH